MTCYNRRATTLRCLRTLFAQELHPATRLEVVLVDDGSTDETSQAVQELFPAVHLLHGAGNLYWNGGMRTAFEYATRDSRYDVVLWVNDDTELMPEAVQRLIDTYWKAREAGRERTLVVGSLRDPQTGLVTYGGVVRKHGWRNPLNFARLTPGDVPLPCDSMNGNLVLIPRAVFQLVGNLDKHYTHSMGDYDYGLRAKKLGASIWIAPGYAGCCARNPVNGSWMDSSLSLRVRWQKALSVKGMPPGEVLHYYRTHGGAAWPLNYVRIYLRLSFGMFRDAIRGLGQGY